MIYRRKRIQNNVVLNFAKTFFCQKKKITLSFVNFFFVTTMMFLESEDHATLKDLK